ncbi:IclR family transcriptional regulator [Georgenia ruanii]|nr:IclR family transcriptional regulator C-terminal domain-containing protein [Georgenia ruanii]MPV89353.1 helix-turn-helix domain-containing protein [Georgenia ruanii]
MSEISKTADKAIALLVELAEEGMATPQKLAARVKMNRTVVQRLLTTLVGRGFVTRVDGEYAVSPRLRRLAAAVQPELRRAAAPHAAALSAKTHETVVVQVLDGDTAVVIAEIVQPSSIALQARHTVGSRSPLTLSASGLAILAALDARDTERILRSADDEDGTLARRLEHIRQTGVATTSDELQEGVSGIAVALRREGVVGSLAILAPTFRAGDLEKHQPHLIRAAARIERSLA